MLATLKRDVFVIWTPRFVHFWTPHFSVWTPHFGWTPHVNYTMSPIPYEIRSSTSTSSLNVEAHQQYHYPQALASLAEAIRYLLVKPLTGYDVGCLGLDVITHRAARTHTQIKSININSHFFLYYCFS